MLQSPIAALKTKSEFIEPCQLGCPHLQAVRAAAGGMLSSAPCISAYKSFAFARILPKMASDSAKDSGLELPSRSIIASMRQLDDSCASMQGALGRSPSSQSDFAPSSAALHALRPTCTASDHRFSFARHTERLSKYLKSSIVTPSNQKEGERSYRADCSSSC